MHSSNFAGLALLARPAEPGERYRQHVARIDFQSRQRRFPLPVGKLDDRGLNRLENALRRT